MLSYRAGFLTNRTVKSAKNDISRPKIRMSNFILTKALFFMQRIVNYNKKSVCANMIEDCAFSFFD